MIKFNSYKKVKDTRAEKFDYFIKSDFMFCIKESIKQVNYKSMYVNPHKEIVYVSNPIIILERNGGAFYQITVISNGKTTVHKFGKFDPCMFCLRDLLKR